MASLNYATWQMKGGRSTDKTKKIREIADKYSGEIEGYKQYAETRRASRTYTQETASELYNRMVTYLIECKKTDTPMAVGKMCLAMGIDRKALHRMKTGEYDWRLYEYMDICQSKGKRHTGRGRRLFQGI